MNPTVIFTTRVPTPAPTRAKREYALRLEADYDAFTNYARGNKTRERNMALQIIRTGLGVDGNSSALDITILDVRRGSIIIEYEISAVNESVIGMASTNMDESLGSSMVIGNLTFNFSSHDVITGAPTADPTMNPTAVPTADPTSADIVFGAEFDGDTSGTVVTLRDPLVLALVVIIVLLVVFVAVLLLVICALQRGLCCTGLRSEERAWSVVLANSPMARKGSSPSPTSRKMTFRNVEGNTTATTTYME